MSGESMGERMTDTKQIQVDKTYKMEDIKALVAENEALKEQVDRLRDGLTEAITAINSLDDDVFGYVYNDHPFHGQVRWPIRSELIASLQKALSAHGGNDD